MDIAVILRRVVGRRDRRLLLALAGIVTFVTVLDNAAGVCAGVLHLVPFLALMAPLLLGRYLGEGALERFRTGRLRPVPRRARTPRWVPGPEVVPVPAPLARALFGRPPPAIT